ncbi:hypothetical protein N7468_003848 [Penicillium chermesinum]|uniref:Rhodopsin domain-containing protein n=1 Tax=Penicillium chermesinum TaxID=63820 RepID=A0A9W9TTS6_9EURO|nr:uncharacterized protein N7468_003848 [Penicillium chermesinum]KAJ5239229.1 hypothetical protein N7468_003848 [Penicillium chermesinum]KAJ6164862.1 hypothetical protein N7470_003534 [Penicillium chermesinum]
MSPEMLAKLLAAPALPPPKGVTPNFDNPPNQNNLAWFVTTICMVVATLCLLLRGYARVWLEKKIGIEEILMFLAYGAYWGTAYAGYSMIYTPGYFVHTWNLHNRDLLILVYGCTYSATLPLIKTAILLDWCRVFAPLDRMKSAFWWGCACVITLQCLWGALCVILLNLQCRPHEAIWKFWLPSKCYSLPDVMLTSATVQVVSDVTMFILPQRIIWTLHMNWQKKLGVSIIFGVGILAVVSACFRLSHTIDFAREADGMYLIGPLLFWACAEMTCGFFILSMPCLSKIIIESGLPRRVKTAFGYSGNSDSKPSNQPTESGPRSGRAGSRPLKPSWMVTETNWSRLDEEGISLDTTQREHEPSESQTHLGAETPSRKGTLSRSDSKATVHITQTFDVSVSEARSGSDHDPHSPKGWML